MIQNAKAADSGKKVKKLPPKPTSFKRSANVGDDEWNLLSSKVQADWTAIRGPPLSVFSWARVVLDEFSYTEGACLVGIQACRGRARWILSGTPPMRDFSEIKSYGFFFFVLAPAWAVLCTQIANGELRTAQDRFASRHPPRH